jgi:hypothetical protein
MQLYVTSAITDHSQYKTRLNSKTLKIMSKFKAVTTTFNLTYTDNKSHVQLTILLKKKYKILKMTQVNANNTQVKKPEKPVKESYGSQA